MCCQLLSWPMRGGCRFVGLVAMLSALVACGAPSAQTAADLDADGIPRDWPPRPAVGAGISAAWPQVDSATLEGPSAAARVQVDVVARRESQAVYLRWVLPGGRGLEVSTAKDGRLVARWPEGTVQLAAELAPLGTRAYPGTAFATQVANLGAQIDLIALPDALVVDVHALSPRLPQVLALVRDLLTAPQLDGALLERLKQRHAADLANEAEDPAAVADRLARRLVFGAAHPYGSLGLTAASVARISRRQVQEAAAAAFRLGGSQVTAVGDTDAATLADLLRKTFGRALEAPSVAVQLPQPVSEETAAGCHLVALSKATQSALVLATPAPPRQDPQWTRLQLANQVLGGSASARLFTELREKRGLGYGAASRLEGRLVGGAWFVAANVRTQATEEALQVIADQLRRLRAETPGVDELTDAQQYLAGMRAMALADGDDLADLLATAPLYHLPAGANAAFLDEVQRLGAGDVAQAAERWPDLAAETVVVAGEITALRPALDARCGRVVEHDAEGRLLRVFVGSDREMTDASRAAAFAGWAQSAAGLAALQRYVADATHAPLYRAQALTVLGASPNAAQMLPMGRRAADWQAIAAELARMMLARLGVGSPEQNAQLRTSILALADGVTGSDAPPDLAPDVAAATKKTLANWALSGMAEDLPEDMLELKASRLAEGDLARLGDGLPVEVLSRWIAGNVRRHEAVRVLANQKTPEANKALVDGYRAFLAGHEPDAEDLAALSAEGSVDAHVLLFATHARLESTPAVATQLAVMAVLRRDLAAMKADQLEAAFERFDAFLEGLLNFRNADDRWWAAELLVTWRGLDGARRVLNGMPTDDHYQAPQWHTVDPKRALAHLTRDVIAPLGGGKLQPMLLAILARHQPMAKVLAVTILKALADDGSVQALKTLGDETDIAALIDLPGGLTVRELALAAVDVCKYIAEVDALEAAGKLAAESAARHRTIAFLTYDLTDKRLRGEVNRQLLGAPPPPPPEAPEAPSQPPSGAAVEPAAAPTATGL